MKNKILQKLRNIEKEHQIKVLYAVESGSRAWGFASKDSDYDVRFIYIHRLEWYLSLAEKRDVIEDKGDGLLDVSGWDIKKTLILFRKSNPPLYEWLESPLVYLEESHFVKGLRKILQKSFSPKASFHHYLSMLVNNHKDYINQPKIKMKKYLYVLRPLFACAWIEKYNTMPPMEFEKLLRSQTLDKKLLDEIFVLLKNKRDGLEQGLALRRKSLDDYIRNKINHYLQLAQTIQPSKSIGFEVLNQLFRQALGEVWGRRKV